LVAVKNDTEAILGKPGLQSRRIGYDRRIGAIRGRVTVVAACPTHLGEGKEVMMKNEDFEGVLRQTGQLFFEAGEDVRVDQHRRTRGKRLAARRTLLRGCGNICCGVHRNDDESVIKETMYGRELLTSLRRRALVPERIMCLKTARVERLTETDV